MKPPATIVVGKMMQVWEKLNWFEKLPLFGQTVVVTRARDQAAALSVPLRQLGAEVWELPTIEIQSAGRLPCRSTRAIAELASYDWLIFTSANGVRCFLERLAASPHDTRAIRGKLCAIGPAIGEALAQVQLKVDLMAEQYYVAEGLLAALAEYPLEGARVLIARAAVARDILPKELAARGARVDVVEAYKTVAPGGTGRARGGDPGARAGLDHVYEFVNGGESGRRSGGGGGAAHENGEHRADHECDLKETQDRHGHGSCTHTVQGVVDAILRTAMGRE